MKNLYLSKGVEWTVWEFSSRACTSVRTQHFNSCTITKYLVHQKSMSLRSKAEPRNPTLHETRYIALVAHLKTHQFNLPFSEVIFGHIWTYSRCFDFWEPVNHTSEFHKSACVKQERATHKRASLEVRVACGCDPKRLMSVTHVMKVACIESQ